MTLLVFYVVLAIGVSFLCSILEAVLLSVTPSYVAQLENERPKVSATLKRLKEDIDRPLAAILTLNTIAHTVGAAGAGAQAASVFGDASLGIFSAILTFLILVGSEIIPKTLGATYWKGLTPFVTRVLPPMIISLWPLVKMSEWLAKLLSSGKKGHAVSREEITALARIGEEAGIVGEDESRIVKNLFRFDEITVEDIMTPRTVMFALDETQTVEDVIAAHETIRFSRIPIYKGAVDDVQGLVLKNDILMCAVRGDASTPLSELKRPISRVPEDVHLKDLFERLLDHNNHLSLVTDPYGGTAGVVSLEDVVETLLGLEIVDEADTAQDLQALARQKWKERASRLGLLTEETEQGGA